MKDNPWMMLLKDNPWMMLLKDNPWMMLASGDGGRSDSRELASPEQTDLSVLHRSTEVLGIFRSGVAHTGAAVPEDHNNDIALAPFPSLKDIGEVSLCVCVCSYSSAAPCCLCPGEQAVEKERSLSYTPFTSSSEMMSNTPSSGAKPCSAPHTQNI